MGAVGDAGGRDDPLSGGKRADRPAAEVDAGMASSGDATQRVRRRAARSHAAATTTSPSVWPRCADSCAATRTTRRRPERRPRARPSARATCCCARFGRERTSRSRSAPPRAGRRASRSARRARSGVGTCADCSVSSDWHRPIWTAASPARVTRPGSRMREHHDRLLRLGRRQVLRAAALVGVDDAVALLEEGDRCARDRTNGRALGGDAERDREAGGGGGRDRVRRAVLVDRRWRRRDRDRLRSAGDRERLLRLRRRCIAAVTRLIRRDRARTASDDRDRGAGDRADAVAGCRSREGDGQAGARGCRDGVGRAAGDGRRRGRRREGDRLRASGGGETLKDWDAWGAGS